MGAPVLNGASGSAFPLSESISDLAVRALSMECDLRREKRRAERAELRADQLEQQNARLREQLAEVSALVERIERAARLMDLPPVRHRTGCRRSDAAASQEAHS